MTTSLDILHSSMVEVKEETDEQLLYDVVVTTNNLKKKEENNEKIDFRVYNEDKSLDRVVSHYRDMRLNQTVEFYTKMELKYTFDNGYYRKLMTIEQAFDELENYIDASDPDLDLPNKLHLLQTAEGIRKDGHPDWFQLVGLLHDMGKIMFLWGTSEDGQDGFSGVNAKQWALGGDTWVVGCQIPSDDNVVFSQFNKLNPDMSNPKYNTKYGMYKPNCGLDQLKFTWGHDEYMYRMLLANLTTTTTTTTTNDNDDGTTCGTIPKEGLDMIRYHSAYPLHEKHAYDHFLKKDGTDHDRIEWIQLFNKYDLYTKDNEKAIDIRDTYVDDLWPYYKELLNKYGLGGILKW